MSKPTRADREAALCLVTGEPFSRLPHFAKAWVELGDLAAWSAPDNCKVIVEALANQRGELLRLAAAVAIKVGEHEYARGRREGYSAGWDDAEEFCRTPQRCARWWDLRGRRYRS